MNDDPIKAAQEEHQRDVATSEKVLFAIRCGAQVRIMHDQESGWEMSGEGLPVFMPLDTGEQAVNLILQGLVWHYRQLTAVLGNPDRHEINLLAVK